MNIARWCTRSWRRNPYTAGIFSAAVADYQPSKVVDGKIPSGSKRLSLELVPTAKVIDEVRARFPRSSS